jgi:hypothetical protein
VEREVMAESLAEPKKHLALDTDWTSAIVAVSAFVIFGFLGVATSWMTLRGTFKGLPPFWWTPLFAGGIIYLGISISDRLSKTVVFVFAIGPLSRMILWSLQASTETRWINEIFVRRIDTVLYFGVCVYVVFWFGSKIRHV